MTDNEKPSQGTSISKLRLTEERRAFLGEKQREYRDLTDELIALREARRIQRLQKLGLEDRYPKKNRSAVLRKWFTEHDVTNYFSPEVLENIRTNVIEDEASRATVETALQLLVRFLDMPRVDDLLHRHHDFRRRVRRAIEGMYERSEQEKDPLQDSEQIKFEKSDIDRNNRNKVTALSSVTVYGAPLLVQELHAIPLQSGKERWLLHKIDEQIRIFPNVRNYHEIDNETTSNGKLKYPLEELMTLKEEMRSSIEAGAVHLINLTHDFLEEIADREIVPALSSEQIDMYLSQKEHIRMDQVQVLVLLDHAVNQFSDFRQWKNQYKEIQSLFTGDYREKQAQTILEKLTELSTSLDSVVEVMTMIARHTDDLRELYLLSKKEPSEEAVSFQDAYFSLIKSLQFLANDIPDLEMFLTSDEITKNKVTDQWHQTTRPLSSAITELSEKLSEVAA